jgi:hypothetical protein
MRIASSLEEDPVRGLLDWAVGAGEQFPGDHGINADYDSGSPVSDRSRAPRRPARCVATLSAVDVACYSGLSGLGRVLARPAGLRLPRPGRLAAPSCPMPG